MTRRRPTPARLRVLARALYAALRSGRVPVSHASRVARALVDGRLRVRDVGR